MSVELLLLHKRVCDTTTRDIDERWMDGWMDGWMGGWGERVAKAIANNRTDNTRLHNASESPGTSPCAGPNTRGEDGRL